MIGGGGERRTIPLVARYADACNFFGDLDTIRRKVAILEQRCADIGRDPAEITKTRLGSLVVAPTMEDARRRARAVAETRGLPPERMEAMFVVGDPDTVAERAQALLDAGLDGLLFNLPDAHEVDPVALADAVVLADHADRPALVLAGRFS
jgi:alkanesulfonate monooxygenase SsuD/methylene tetrahydromethanopterin reductase-like flavin-dependent oxidoreductase (luciferase family)